MMSRPLKVRIVSRYVPIAGRAGHFTYTLELMQFLAAQGFRLELDVLDPWFLATHIPDTLRQIAEVVIMPAEFLHPNRPGAPQRSVPGIWRILATALPSGVSAPLRTTWYRLRHREIPGLHRPDARATNAEIAFVQARMHVSRPDVLIANETFLGNILDASENDKTLLRISIAFDLHHQRQAILAESGLAARCSDWDREKEMAVLKAAQLVVAIHADDAHILRDMLPHVDVLCVPFPARVHPHDPAEQVARRCVFVGSSIVPNTQGLLWFLREVWPLVLRAVPHAMLHVCGTVCDSISESAPNTRLLGRLENLAPEYGAAELCVIPLLAGSGLKIKLIEALAHGRACVSTSIGVQGVQELKDKAVLVADTPQDFAQAVISVLTDADKRRAMEAQARRYVVEELAPEKVYQPFVERVSRHLAHRKRRPLCQ